MVKSTARRWGAVAFALALVLGACSGDDDDTVESAPSDVDAGTDAGDDTGDAGDDSDAGGDASADDTTTDGAAGGDGEDGAPADPATQGGGTDPATDPGPASSAPPTGESTTSAPAATEAPARPVVPRDGTYTYERTTTSEEGTETSSEDSEVRRVSGDDQSGRVELSQDSELGPTTITASVGDSGAVVEKSVTQSPLGEVNCDWEPAWQLYGPFQTGSEWTIDTKCSDEPSPGVTVDVTITGTGTVTGFETITVRGKTVTAWVVESDITTDAVVSSPTVGGTQRTNSVSTTWIDPANGMPIKTVSTTDSEGDFGSGTSESVSELVSIS